MIGRIISHYRILEKLGEGGMGVVYKAHDNTLDRVVALKFLPHYLTSDAFEKERFYHEAKAASALNHTNITTTYEIAEYDNQLFIVMEWVEGKTFKELVEHDILPINKILDIAIQVCDGLAAAHEKSIVHRDIKSENIMLTPKGRVKIMDFGLAKVKGATKLTKKGSTLGTIAYMSPEQVRGEEVDTRSDLFSFGIVLYELLTGRLPFAGEYEAAVSYAILNETPAAVRSIRPEISPRLEKIVERCLQKERGKRYQRSEELIDDLHTMPQERSVMGKNPAKSAKVWWLAGAVMLSLLLLGVFLYYPRSDSPSRDLKSIAVLPFKNLSDSKEDEYFSDGITDDIIAQLSKITDLKVISRTSTMHYKGMNKKIYEIGKELNVTTVLEGSVRHAGDQVRIVAQLIDARNEGHIWAETYDKGMTQIFAVQSDVAKQIAAALEAKISPAVKSRIDKKQTENTEAYQLYLKGRFFWNKRVLDDVKTAIGCFKQAYDKDPDYALAYAGLASAYVVIPSFGVLPAELYMNARNAAMKALEIDSTLAEAHTVLAEIAGSHYYDWVEAEKHYRRAIELDPSYPTAHQWYSTMLMFLGRFDEAFTEAKRALELDPLSLVINLNLGDVYYAMRQYDKAIEQYKNIIALDETFPWSYSGLAGIYEVQGRFDDAIVEYTKAKDLGGNMPYSFAILGPIYIKSGRKADALKMLNELLRLNRQGNSVAYGIASVYYELGEKEKAFAWLEKSYQNREMWLLVLGYDPLWDDIRSDPRGLALLKKMGLRK